MVDFYANFVYHVDWNTMYKNTKWHIDIEENWNAEGDLAGESAIS